MKLTVFQSDKGDCLLLTAASGQRMLVDGGMTVSYNEHVAPALGKLRDDGGVLDIVYVSHIDDDHIGGILNMMDDAVAWRVHDFQVGSGNPNHREPEVPRPPDVKAIWLNAFHEMVDDNDGRIENMLAASAAILSGHPSAEIRRVGIGQRDLVTSKKQAIQLSRRVGASQLNIPLNPQFGGKLMMVQTAPAVLNLGTLSVSIIGPFAEDLDKLRKEWNAWLSENQETLTQIRRRAADDNRRLGTSEVDRLIRPMLSQAQLFGDRAKVTPPNLASLMILAEEGGKTVLLTGDGHADDILKGLEHHGKLDAAGRLHVDVLKVQHHGSEHNIHQGFCQRITADTYIFCGNGFSTNPELGVIDLITGERVAGDARHFKFRFNTRSTVIDKELNKTHMAEVETRVTALAAKWGGRLSFEFLENSSFEMMV